MLGLTLFRKNILSSTLPGTLIKSSIQKRTMITGPIIPNPMCGGSKHELPNWYYAIVGGCGLIGLGFGFHYSSDWIKNPHPADTPEIIAVGSILGTLICGCIGCVVGATFPVSFPIIAYTYIKHR